MDDRKGSPPVDPNDPTKPSTAPAEDVAEQERERERIQRKPETPEDEGRAKDSLDKGV